MTLPAFATDRRAAVDMDQKAAAPAADAPCIAIDIACPQGPQQQTRLTLQRANGTDRRTPYRYIDPAAYYRVGQKTGLFFRLDNFVTVSPRKACSMSKFSQFYREKGTKLAF